LKSENLLKSRFGAHATPQVAGVLSSLPEDYLARIKAASPDLVELRLDQLPAGADWLSAGKNIEREKIPVLGTLRLSAEGGGWAGEDHERVEILKKALEAFSAIDVELASPLAETLAPLARELGKVLILSHHNFVETESLPVLQKVVEHAQRLGGIAKVACMVKSPSDIETLVALLKKPMEGPVCVIGMGSTAEYTRIEFPARGSCLAYGYLDRPSAPGQPSAGDLIQGLTLRIPAYRDSRQNP
jgi:3-dehydroquinate dehydratase-1